MRLLKLTLKVSGEPIYLNPSHVVAAFSGGSSVTTIKVIAGLDEKSEFGVAETLEAVVELFNSACAT